MNNLEVCVALSSISFLKYQEKVNFLTLLKSLDDLKRFSIADISSVCKRQIKSKLWDAEKIIRQTERKLKILDAYKINYSVFNDEKYPYLLSEIYDPPFMIFWRGSLDSLNKKTVAIVGTRKPTLKGLKAAEEIAMGLVEQNITVVSGLAIGIDTASHRGVLRSHGKTVAVLACGVDRFYPSINSRLGASIIENGGAILSEYPPDEEPLRFHFPARNRIISALSLVTAVIEAPQKSGALITADFAIEQGREVVFHKCSLEYPELKKDLIQDEKVRCVQHYVRDGAVVFSSVQELTELVEKSQINNKRLPLQLGLSF